MSDAQDVYLVMVAGAMLHELRLGLCDLEDTVEDVIGSARDFG